MAKNTVMMGLAGALVCGLAGVGALGDDEHIALAPEEGGFALLPPVEYTGYKCKSYTACPLTRLVDRYGRLKGCAYNAETKACSGNCIICPGSTTPANVCVKAAGEDCISAGAGTAACGTTTLSNPCFYSTTLDLTEPCSCSLTSASSSNSPCSVAQCQAS